MNLMIVKLRNDDMFMADTVEMDDEGFLFHRPISIRHSYTSDSSGKIVSKPSIGVYCDYTADEYFSFDNDVILYAKPLHESFYTFYAEMSEAFYRTTTGPIPKMEDNIYEDDEPYVEENDKKVVH